MLILGTLTSPIPGSLIWKIWWERREWAKEAAQRIMPVRAGLLVRTLGGGRREGATAMAGVDERRWRHRDVVGGDMMSSGG